MAFDSHQVQWETIRRNLWLKLSENKIHTHTHTLQVEKFPSSIFQHVSLSTLERAINFSSSLPVFSSIAQLGRCGFIYKTKHFCRHLPVHVYMYIVIYFLNDMLHCTHHHISKEEHKWYIDLEWWDCFRDTNTHLNDIRRECVNAMHKLVDVMHAIFDSWMIRNFTN